MKYKILVIFSFLFTTISANCQSLSREVIGSAGDFNSASGASLSWTMGEVMTDSYFQTSGQLTQGFQQPTLEFAGLPDYSRASVTVYPNPSSDLFFLNFYNVPSELEIVIFDSRGRIIQRQFAANTPQETVDLSELESGIYVAKFIYQSTEVFSPIKLQKTL